MCYFINVNITPEGQPAKAKESVERLAKRDGIRLRGEFPLLQLTDGHCSCPYVLRDNCAISIASLVEDLVKADEVKRLEVGWAWAKDACIVMKPDTPVQRLSIQEFVALNAIGGLQPEVCYRLNDPKKYSFAEAEAVVKHV